MLVNTLAYGWSAVATVLCVLLLLVEYRKAPRDSAENNAEFRKLQKRFIAPYLAVLFAESLQVPYLYVLFRQYAFERHQIAALYVVGLVTTILVVLTCNLSTKLGRRLLCVVCIGAGSLGCFLKLSNNFLVLLIGRVFDGIFSALITTPFQSWYTHEHVTTFDFPTEWLSSSFTIISISSGILAVFAGFVAELVEFTTAFTVSPFLIAIFPLMIVLFILCATSVFADLAVQLIAFIWSPVLIHAKYNKHNLGFGAVFACFTASSLLGSVLFSSPIMRKLPVSRILTLSLLIACIALFKCIQYIPAKYNELADARFIMIICHLIILHIALGFYTLAINRLQLEFFPSAHRTALLAGLRVPVTLLASLIILFAFPAVHGERTIVTMAAALLVCPAIMAFVLDIYLGLRGRPSQPGNADRFTVPPSKSGALYPQKVQARFSNSSDLGDL